MPCKKCGSYNTINLYVLDQTGGQKGFVQCGEICNFCGHLEWDHSGDGYANIYHALRGRHDKKDGLKGKDST